MANMANTEPSIINTKGWQAGLYYCCGKGYRDIAHAT